MISVRWCQLAVAASAVPAGPRSIRRVSDTDGSPLLRGLVVDWGGVLTPPPGGAMGDVMDLVGVRREHYQDVLRRWSPLPGATDATDVPTAAEPDSPVHRLERGDITEAEFEVLLAAELTRLGSPVPAEGLLARVMAGLQGLDPAMIDLVRRARARGVRTALLSNSWGEFYPDALWDGLFDAVVISGRVGLRKPDPAIYRLTCERIGLPPQECVMVDDLPANVRAAVGVGMVGVLHVDVPSTRLELEVLLGGPPGTASRPGA